MSIKLRKFHLLIISELEFQEVIPYENVDGEIPPKTKVPSEVRAARKNVVRQTPQRKLHKVGMEMSCPFAVLFVKSTLSMDFWFEVSILYSQCS